eukprot:gb/GECH01012525.1/.p1 GENE.gb/GECH01012525.1/~~gb/GECH01012525.1/.p1  ORF type:complete len:531 (+),score=119.92 gb/GECH01012525.1/:1-1593(+)
MSAETLQNNDKFELPKARSLPDFTTWLNSEQFASDNNVNENNNDNNVCEPSSEPNLINPPSLNNDNNNPSEEFQNKTNNYNQNSYNDLLDHTQSSEPFFGCIDNTDPFSMPPDFSMQRSFFPSYEFPKIPSDNNLSSLQDPIKTEELQPAMDYSSQQTSSTQMNNDITTTLTNINNDNSFHTNTKQENHTPKKRGRKKGKKSASKPAKFVKEPHVIIKDENDDNVLVCKQVHDKEPIQTKQSYNLFVCKDLRLGKGRRKPIEKHISFENEIPSKTGYIRSTYKHKQEVLGFHVVVKPEWDLNKDRYPPGHKIWIWAGSDCVEETTSAAYESDSSSSSNSLQTGVKRMRDLEELPTTKRRRLGDHSIIHSISDNIKHITVSETKDFYCAQVTLGASMESVWENLADFSILSNVWPSVCSFCNISKVSNPFCPLGVERTVNLNSTAQLPSGTATHRLMAISQIDHTLSYEITYHNNLPQLQGTVISVKLRPKDENNIIAEIGSDNLDAVKLLEPRIISALKDMSARWPAQLE